MYLQVEQIYGGLCPKEREIVLMEKRRQVKKVTDFLQEEYIQTVQKKHLHKNLTMARTSHYGSIGAIIMTKASSFHPGEYIWNEYPKDYCTRPLRKYHHHERWFGMFNKHDQKCCFV